MATINESRTLPGEILEKVDQDGIEFIRRVRARSGKESTVPAVALTAWGLPRDRARAKEAGFQAHLVKPVDPSTLVSVLGALAVRS